MMSASKESHTTNINNKKVESFIDLEAGAPSESKLEEKREKGEAERKTWKKRVLLLAFSLFALVLVGSIVLCGRSGEGASVSSSYPGNRRGGKSPFRHLLVPDAVKNPEEYQRWVKNHNFENLAEIEEYEKKQTQIRQQRALANRINQKGQRQKACVPRPSSGTDAEKKARQARILAEIDEENRRKDKERIADIEKDAEKKEVRRVQAERDWWSGKLIWEWGKEEITAASKSLQDFLDATAKNTEPAVSVVKDLTNDLCSGFSELFSDSTRTDESKSASADPGPREPVAPPTTSCTQGTDQKAEVKENSSEGIVSRSDAKTQDARARAEAAQKRDAGWGCGSRSRGDAGWCW